ncbi:unnamed protein product, partial [Ixodes hexagonus]
PSFQSLVCTLIKILEQPADESCHLACLETLRILSRDKDHLEEVFTPEVLASLARTAELTVEEEDVISEGFKEHKARVIVEAQKALCNLIYNSPVLLLSCYSNGCVEGVMLRLKLYGSPSLPHDVKFFDMRMLFLLTALCADTRPRVRTEQHGLVYLRETLDLILKLCEERSQQEPRTTPSRRGRLSRRGRTRAPEPSSDTDLGTAPLLDADEAALASEVLKVLYNLTCGVDKFHVDEEEEVHFQRLVGILHDLLLCDVADPESKDQLCGQVVHLLSNMPRSTYEELLTEVIAGSAPMDPPEEQFEGFNTEAVSTLLGYLERRLKEEDQSQRLSPILLCLTECARGHRTLRRYLRSKVLPPLSDVMTRPEEGDKLRNRLVRLMTSSATDVKNLTADFLFVLCKEKVGRMVKYTGYGNAAGLLARRGLLLGGPTSDCSYSSDSEDSDTEEYAKYKDRYAHARRLLFAVQTRLLVKCYEPEFRVHIPKAEPAAELVSVAYGSAFRGGVVQPARVGADGRPYPIEHILQLQEGLPHDRDFTESESD